MIPRTLEPEVMDTEQEAVDYDAMDHSAVNRVFVDDLLRSFTDKPPTAAEWDAAHPMQILDLGTGTALIPIELCRRSLPWPIQVHAVDMSFQMVRLAARNIADAGLEAVISCHVGDAKNLRWKSGSRDAVISNSIIHHIPEPHAAFREMLRIAHRPGLLFARDLLRPDDYAAVDHLVQTYAGDTNSHQQAMFRASLRAALTLDEVRDMLKSLDVPVEWANQTSDRHWTIAGWLCES